MEFLVEIGVSLPPAMDDRERLALLERERDRGEELVAEGAIVRIWRLPGRLANVGIWSAEDATALHQRLSSLPVWPYSEVSVTALAEHPLEAGQ